MSVNDVNDVNDALRETLHSTYARAWAVLSEASALLPAYFDTTEAGDMGLGRCALPRRR